MALLHSTTLVPSKAELIGRWLPGQEWSATDGSQVSVEQLGSFRLDDPDGEVGIETLLVRTPDGVVLQVPVTYHGEPLAGAEEHLIGTAEHGVLGRRWVYDGCHDPAYVRAVTAAILTGDTEAVENVQGEDGAPRPRTPKVRAVGSGSESPGDWTETPLSSVQEVDGRTLVRTDQVELQVIRRPLVDRPADRTQETLTGRWGEDQAVLVGLRRLATPTALPKWYGELNSALDQKMGLEVLELTPERVVGRMPVAGNTQPMGLWHGGASCVLAETLASIGSVAHAMPDRVAVGVDINATHHRAARDGWVTGTATALKLGRTVAMYEVVLVDDTGARICTGRVTCQLVAAPPQRPSGRG